MNPRYERNHNCQRSDQYLNRGDRVFSRLNLSLDGETNLLRGSMSFSPFTRRIYGFSRPSKFKISMLSYYNGTRILGII